MASVQEIRFIFSPDNTPDSVQVQFIAPGAPRIAYRMPVKPAWFALYDAARHEEGLARGMSSNRPAPTTQPPSALGRELFDALFQEPTVLAQFLAWRERVRSTDADAVRVRLAFGFGSGDAARFTDIPWELMRSAQDPPLASSSRLLLVRSNDVEPRTAQFSPVSPLQILVVKANPTDTELNLDEEAEQLAAAFKSAVDVEVDVVRGTREAVAAQMAKPGKNYRVLHFMGHGDTDPVRGARLLFEANDGSRDEISADELAMLTQDEPFRLIFLNACSTAGIGAGTDAMFSGLLPALLEKVPAVIVMQRPVRDSAALSFSKTFYERIADGLPVDVAMAEARKLLFRQGASTEWLTPVLYLSTSHGELFAPTNLTPRLERPTTADSATVVSPQSRRWNADPNAVRILFAPTAPELQSLRDDVAETVRALGGVDCALVPSTDVDVPDDEVSLQLREADVLVHLLGPDVRTPTHDVRFNEMRFASLGLKAGRPQVMLILSEHLGRMGFDYAALIQMMETLSAPRQRLHRVMSSRAAIAGDAKTAVQDVLKWVRSEQSVPGIVSAVPAATPEPSGRSATNVEDVPAPMAQVQAQAQAPAPSPTGARPLSALMDVHDVDKLLALTLEDQLFDAGVQVITSVQDTSNVTPPERMMSNRPDAELYVLVAKDVDRDWAENRMRLAKRSAMTINAPRLLYMFAPVPEERTADGTGNRPATDQGEEKPWPLMECRLNVKLPLPKSFEDVLPGGQA